MRSIPRIVSLGLVLVGSVQAGEADVPTLEALQSHVDEVATSVLESVGASPAQCPEVFAVGPGWAGAAALHCGKVALVPETIGAMKKNIVDRLVAAGLQPDAQVPGGSSWARSEEQSFEFRSFVDHYLPVQVVVDPGEGYVAVSYPAPVEATDAISFVLPDSVDTADAVTNPRILRKAPPVYPELAKQARLTGNVILKAVIGQDGRVRDVVLLRVDKPNLGFEQAAAEALEKWLYVPATHAGRPVDVYFTINISFTLH